MQIKSPLSNLCATLVQIQESAKQYRAALSKNEAATRAVLIDPVLRSLGWDTANTDMVEVEKTMHNGRADYALFDSNSIPKIIVEAKALGTNLDQKTLVLSLVNYAFSFGLNDVFLTDGLIWEHFDNFQPQNHQPSRILNLETDNPVDCSAYFVQHLDAAKYWSVEQNLDALSQRVDELENIISNLQRKISEISSSDSAKPTKQSEVPLPSSKKFIELSQLNGIAGKKPLKYRLPNGEILDVKTWKDILRESCKFTLISNPSIKIPYPDRIGKKVLLFNFQKPDKKASFITERYNGQEIFIYLNYDSHNCVLNALYVLENLPKSLRKVSPAVILDE